MDGRPGRDVSQRKGIAGSYLGARTRLQDGSRLDPERSKDIGLFTIGIMQQS
jgi:hypothetical protein